MLSCPAKKTSTLALMIAVAKLMGYGDAFIAVAHKLCYGNHKGHNWYNGKECVVGQCRRGLFDSLVSGEELDERPKYKVVFNLLIVVQ